ncbi:hypothetical protein, partial [Kocuria salsicia]|uniref:hypothetical protein n=1 Tax=Kocuria salsicia TaxID=664639 RepID=UPI001C92C148
MVVEMVKGVRGEWGVEGGMWEEDMLGRGCGLVRGRVEEVVEVRMEGAGAGGEGEGEVVGGEGGRVKKVGGMVREAVEGVGGEVGG